MRSVSHPVRIWKILTKCEKSSDVLSRDVEKSATMPHAYRNATYFCMLCQLRTNTDGSKELILEVA